MRDGPPDHVGQILRWRNLHVNESRGVGAVSKGLLLNNPITLRTRLGLGIVVGEIAWFQQLPLTPFRVMHKKRRPKIGRRFRSQQQFAEKGTLIPR
jgi:hypothetical protein